MWAEVAEEIQGGTFEEEVSLGEQTSLERASSWAVPWKQEMPVRTWEWQSESVSLSISQPQPY